MTDKIYSVLCEPSSAKEETGVYRSAFTPSELISGLLDQSVITCADIFHLGKSRSKSGMFLGTRKPEAESFLWKTYSVVDLMARNLGSGLLHLDLVPERIFDDEKFLPAKNMRILGICLENREEWIISELACSFYGITLVPMYDNMRDSDVRWIVENSKMKCVFVTKKTIKKIVNNLSSPDLECIIFLDAKEDLNIEESLGHLEVLNVEIKFFDDILQEGRNNLLSPKQVDPGSVNSIVYTSGTTGPPKGVICTHANLVSAVCACVRGPMSQVTDITCDDIHFSYLPLSHLFERMLCQLAMITGAQIGFYSGNAAKVLEDLRLLKPTVFVSVPRLFLRIRHKIFSTLQEKPFLSRLLFKGALKFAISMKSMANLPPLSWLFLKPRLAFGGKLKHMIVGGAKLDPSIEEEFKAIFGIPLVEGYGLSETMAASFVSLPEMPSGSVGGPIGSCEFKIRSRPDLGFLISDDPPRGELMCRGPAISPGYFRNERETSLVFQKDGWFLTGDIVSLGSQGQIYIIDRAKDIFKLAQGEYVSPSKIEEAYRKSELIAEIFVDGQSSWACPKALIWIVEAEVRERLNILDTRDPVNAPLVRELIEKDLKEHDQGLLGFERIGDFEIARCRVPTVDAGTLTATMKLRRAYIMENTTEDFQTTPPQSPSNRSRKC
eukprot:GHVP01025509.1.p1 GENE.GHVP01025509.1~~GHVP01025509.1.p1  ORF type:complete len:664 (+),score=105.56 GHVP01025509.1:81-2072(+)